MQKIVYQYIQYNLKKKNIQWCHISAEADRCVLYDSIRTSVHSSHTHLFLCRHFSWYTKSMLFCKHLSISTIGWQVASSVFNSSTCRFRIYLNECRSSYQYGEIQIFWSPGTPVTISCLTHITSSSTSWYISGTISTYISEKEHVHIPLTARCYPSSFLPLGYVEHFAGWGFV